MKYRTKRIYLNTEKTNYCALRLYRSKKEMNEYYFYYNKKYGKEDQNHDCLGVSLHYTIYKKEKLSPQTGMVLLSIENCGASVVTHELLHAVLYAWKMSLYKKQYPIIIRSMNQEEELLQNHSSAVQQFYIWYYKVIKSLKQTNMKKKKKKGTY